MQKIDIKKKILATNYFIDNEFLDKYIELILNNKLAKRIKYRVSKHHIIPVSYYNLCKLPTNNDISNCVLLYNEDHVLAHYYLTKCTKGQLNIRLLIAFNMMIGEHNKYKVPNDKFKLMPDLINTLNKARKEFGKIMTNTSRSYESIQKSKETLMTNYGVKSVSQLPGVGDKISKTKKGKSTITDYQRNILRESAIKQWTGTHKSEETKQKISNSLKGHTHSDYTKLKISNACKGHKPPNAGKIAVNSDKTKYISILEFKNYNSFLKYLNNEKLNPGMYINNRLKQNKTFKLINDKYINILNRVKVSFEQNN